MNDYKTIADRNIQAPLDLIEKQMAYMEAMMRPTAAITHKTLRDEFAMAALTGLLANPALEPTIKKHGASWFDKNAYLFADAMMEARK
jgi:hypothetical protein